MLLGRLSVSGYLPGRVVLPEVAKSRLKPCVDIAQSELLIRRLNNGLKEQRTKKGEMMGEHNHTHKKSEIEGVRRVGEWRALVHTSAQNHRIRAVKCDMLGLGKACSTADLRCIPCHHDIACTEVHPSNSPFSQAQGICECA